MIAMKPTQWLPLLILSATLLHSQSSGDATSPDLGTLPVKQLVACFADWKICGAMNSLATGWQLSDEIAKRGNPHTLLNRYWTEPNQETRTGIVHVAYHFHSREVTAFMRRVLVENRNEASELYWPAKYLAKMCDPEGLKWLSSRKGRDQGCIQFTGTVNIFGKCSYRPAVPYLIENSMHDACLNIVSDAEESLERLYPDHPNQFQTLAAEQEYYCERAKKEGFDVNCDSK